MFRRLLKMGLGLLLLANALIAQAAESTWEFSGDLTLQTRVFADKAAWPGQASQYGQASVAATAELRWRSANGNQRAALLPYARWDEADSDRSLLDLREAYWAWEGDNIEVLVGANTVFWGVTESVHLVDIINQTDAVADIDGEDKLGQPMINVALQQDWGLLSVYVMPYFRERTFPGAAGRLRFPLPIDTDRPRYGSPEAERHVDLALRYSHYIGDIDIGVSLFSGTSREPRLLPADNFSVLLPQYDLIDQLGLDLQYTRNAWLWKLEAFVRDGYADTFAAAVGGFEYTHYQVRGSAADIGLLLEYQYDGRADSEPLTIADNDLFVGARLALNDTQNSSVLAGIVRDIETGEIYFNVEAERRLGDSFVLELRARAFSGASPGDLTFSFSNDNYLQLQISKFF
jgi:hypothetical protein